MRKILLAAAMLGGLSACASPSTDEIGARVGGDAIANPPGQNSFHAVFDPNNPGVPLSVSAASGKDDEGVNLNIAYEYPDGTRVTWAYAVDTSKGSEQTAAITAAVQAVAEIQGTAVEELAPDVVQSITALVRAALGVAPQSP